MVGAKFKPVAIGRLERFVADCAMGRGWDEPLPTDTPPPTAPRPAPPSSVRDPPAWPAPVNWRATASRSPIFEALHVAGGVLKYGIPEFRLPDMIIDAEIDNLKKHGRRDPPRYHHRQAVHHPPVAHRIRDTTRCSWAPARGRPNSPAFPARHSTASSRANEFLTRVNLMRGHRQPIYDTPVGMGKRVAVVGAGNTAMDSCRVAQAHGRRKGHRRVSPVAPRIARARIEELEHAIEEGIEFLWLTNPVEIVGDAAGWVTGMRVREDGPRRAGRLRAPPAGAGGRFANSCSTWTP